MSQSNTVHRVAVKSAVFWGSLASALVYGLVHSQILTGQFVHDYLSSHPVEYIATVMFFIGLAALGTQAMDVLRQQRRLRRRLLEPARPEGEPVETAEALLLQLDQLPKEHRRDYLVCRLRDTLEYVRRRGSADALEDRLKYQADLDAERLHAGYALVRVIIWAIPILGFLGTVIGITMAIGQLAPQALETSLPEVMAALSVAFHTTTQALGLSIVLMFAQFAVGRMENSLLAAVDARAEAELIGRFEQLSPEVTPQVNAVRKMGEAVMEANERLVARQAALWRDSMEEAAGRWTNMADAAAVQLQQSLAGALRESLQDHARQLAGAEQETAEHNRRHWGQVQQSQERAVEAMQALQLVLAKEAESLARAVEAVGKVASLEDVLNRNLSALAGAKHFEETVMSLAAAIQLLNARLADAAGDASPVQLEPKPRKGQAA